MKQVVNAWSVLLLFTGAVVSHGRKIVQDHHAAIETDADKEFGTATLQRFEAKAMQLLAHLESKINSVDTHRVEQDAPQIVTIPQTATLPARNTSHPMEMFEGCKASSPVEALLRRTSQVHEEETQEAVNESTSLGARCALYQMPMTYYRWDRSTASSSCCDSRSKDCSGCERMGSGKCTVRESAFVKLKGDDMHTACMDIVWVNGKGKTCQQLSSADCNDFRFQGTSSREACCKCGGGVKTATSFKYDDHAYILGEHVSMWPQPRTATRYGLNENCEFAMYNLTLNGATGEVSFIKGAGKPKEPFRISCKVTAFQPHHLFFTATVTVTMAELSYGPSLLLFTPKTKSYTLQKFSPPKSHWKDFQMMCAPDAKWVTMDKTGDLKLAEAKETGAVDSVKDVYKGQTATVCHVFGLLRKSPTAEWEKKAVDFILVKPKPAKKLSYSTSLIASSISQVVPPVLPVPFKEGDMAPNAYTMRCDKAGFTFDSIHGIGFYDGHPLLELQPNGQLSLNIGPSFVHIFDSMGSSKHNRKIGLLDLKLKCRIFGSFGDAELEPISARMDIVVSDSTCWVQEKMPYRNIRRWHGVNSHAECQNTCRNTASCSHYRYIRRGAGSANAYCYDTKRDETRSTATVWSKVPDCNPMNTCVKVDAPTWLERGIYCPVGYDIDRQSMTYLKDGKTPKETIYLRRYKAGVDRTVDGCNSGGWLLQEKDANDFVSLSKGVFEFSGPLVGCKVKGVSYTGLPCEQPGNITEEGADMQPIILDDPNTEDPADFWLHPCDCASKMWGDKPPVDPQVFAQMPPESPDEFVPSPMLIVEGQFVCPPGYMLGDGPLFESDIESMEVGDCEIRCKNNDDCHFFWHGSQHSANTCRLYSRCDNLLREPGVEGVLKAVPRSPVCLVNNPEMCWTKSMRRYALTSQQPPGEFQFLYWTLHAQCDYMLLLGGWGVSACTRPSHRTLKSHRWKHKRLLPEEFAHGTRLKATCWNERYKGIRLGIRGDEVATCVSGSWFSSSNLPGFGDFSCVGCVQVGTSGFGDVEAKRQQELYYFNKLALSIHSEVNPIADAKVNCMEPVRPKAGQETSLPKDLKKVHTFDLKGHDFTIINDVIGDQTLWANNEASKNKYTYQSLPEALAACAADSDCWFVSRSEGTKVGLALRRFDLRKGNTVRFVGAKTWVKSLANPCIGNCAALRPVKCGPGVSACGRSLVDGRKAGSLWGVSPHARSHHCHQKKWVQIDLGSIKAFDQVKVFGYADGRRYCGHSILVSNNEKDWKHVYANNGWKAREHGKGNTFNLGSQVGRYVRVYASRSTSNIGIHLLEVEIYRAAVHQPKLPGSHWITDQHVKELRAKARKPSVLQDGLVMYYYYGQSHCNVPDLGKLTPEHYVIVPKVSGFPGIRQHDHFCVRCIGFVNIRKRGHYYFYTSSDDGSLLYLNGHLIVNNNGCHANQQRGSTRRWLEKGRHRLVADMCENAWGQYFEVRYKGPDSGNRVIAIPRSALKYEKAATEVELKDGAECNYYYGRHDCNVPNLDNLNPSHIVTVPEIYMSQSKFTEINQADNFCARCTAQVAITKEGHYKFTTASDDGSLMYLNGQQIVDNNGCHPEQERTSSNQWLTPGYHLVQVDMCENKYGEALKLRYQGPDTGNRKVKVSKSVLKHEKAGLECKYFYHRHHCWLPDLGRLHAHHTVTVPDIWMDHGKFPAHRHRDAFCMRCSGYLVIRRAGHYRFSTSSDDGSFLFISGHKVVDNNGCHGTQERQSTWRWLHAGKHRFTADMCEKGGGESFKVMYQGPDTGNRKIKIPKESLLKPGTATNTKSFQALDTVIADFRQHGTLKSGKIVFSKHSEKITCKIFCDDVLVHEEYHNHIGHRDREVSIPEICKGARKVKLQGGAANGGTCGFKSNKLELFKFMPTRTLTKSQVSTIKDRAASCRARYSASGQVTIKLDDYGEIAPGNKVNFGRHVRSKCEVHCNGKKQTVYSGRRRHRHRQTFDVSKGCIGATTMVLKGGGKCGGCQIDKGHLKVSPYPTHPSEVMIPAKKIVAWFKSEDAGPTWRSSVGKFTASARRRNGVVAYKARGYGAKTPIRYIQGHTGHHFDFGRVLQDHYTVCSVTRYLSAGSTGRILTGSKSNFLHGHHAAGVGLAYANGWQTPTGLRKKSTKWLTMCSSPGAKYVFVDGVDVGTHKTDSYVDQHLEINGRLWPKEKSDWAVAELITWNYILTREQMKEASTYLMKKLMVGGEMDACKVILKQPEHWRDWRGSYNKQVLNRLRLHKSTKRVDLALDSTSGWCSSSNGGHQWVEIDLRATEKVMGIIIQTFHKSDDYVFAFKVQYKASDKGSWRTIPNRFTGMSHKTEDHVRAYFAEAVEARFVRLTSFWWHRNICLRAAVMLCKTHLENEVNLLQAKTCPTNYNSESWSESDSGSRHLRIGGSPDCLRVTQTKKRMALLSATCDGDDVHQMIPSSDIGYLFTMLHRNSWLQDNVLLPGIKAEYFYNLKADHCVIPDLMWRAPDKVEVLPKLDFWKKTSWSGLKHNDKFSARMSGVLMINEPGWYEFWLWADDSSRIFLNHREIGSLGGCGATRHRYVKRKLTMGSWPVEVQFYESVGEASLRLEYRGPDTHKKKRIVPGTAFAHMADKTQWMPTSAIARGCIGNTALGSLQPDMFLVSDLAKGVPVDCRFVPLLSKELPVQIATTRSFKDNSWPLWWEDLESWEMACPEGKVLQSLDMLNVNNKLQVKYTCATASGLGQCYPSWTDQQDAHEFKDSVLSKSILKRLHIVCPQHDLLSAVHFEYSEGGLWARFKYVCCKEAGAPVAMVSKGPDHARVNRLEGTYCPEKVGSSGRLDYIQKAWGSWQTKKLAKLTFSEVSGKWCIGSDCSSPGDNVEPMGLQLGGFDATDVSDFDGKFEAKGVKPNTGGLLGQSPVPKLKPPPPPRRPKAPKKPKLETFEPEMPKYSDKCVGYGDLWKKVQETTVNEAGEEESNAEELETEEESQSGYKAMHPCDLAAAYGGVRSKWGGGDGKAIPKPMPYNELMGCLDRDGAVSFKGQEIIRHLGFIIEGMNLPAAIASTTCTLAPEILTAPMGFGASADLADICKGIVHSVTAGVKLLKYAGSEILRSQINKAAAADCAATQANFARMFCDVHCVRDAVIRGDRTILRNLKKATDITNGNAEKLAEWIVKTQQLDVSWLAEKIDHQSVVQSLESNKQFTNIKELLNGGDKKELFLAIKQQTIKLQSELRGYVDGASFGKASLLAASDALEKFNGNSKSVLQDGNSTEQVFGAFDSLVSLRAKLRTASDQRSRVDHIAMSVTQGARQMQEQLKLQRATLGIYRENGNRTLQAARQRSSLATSERHAMVLDLDRIWWKIRGAVDSYVDEAENEINSFESGSQAMANYQQCSMDFASLLSVYRHTMAVTDTSHRALKKTWRLCSNLIGELASHLDDGEAFVTFLQQEGCASPLAFQTLEQVRDVMGSLRMLYHRFAVSGLASPELSFVESTVDRIKKTWSSAQAVVCNRTAQLPIWYFMPVDTEKALEQLEVMRP